MRKKKVWYKKNQKEKKRNIKFKKEGVYLMDLNYYILQVSSGEIVCNEAKKKLCNDET